MSKILLKSATLICPEHPLDGKSVNLLIEDGVIRTLTSIEQRVETDSGDKVVHAEGHFVAPGFLDLNCNFGEPGMETKETIQSGCAAAASGGFTAVALHPNTSPAVASQAEVRFLVQGGRAELVSIYPVGALSRAREGKELAEMFDMSQAGAIAFSDGNRPVEQAGLMSRALLYAKGIGARVFSFPEDASLAGKGKMNEGVMSTYLGMKGIPNIAEELMVSRDLQLAAYHDAPIHFSTISTAGSVRFIREAKASGIPVTCDVAVHHLVLHDESIAEFNSNYKVKPPLRTEMDIKALREGLEDGTIDAIVTQHTPQEPELKNVEFEIAADGMIGLQTALPLLLQSGLRVELIVEKLSLAPRRILGLTIPTFGEGEQADLVLFSVEEQWMLNSLTNRSLSCNTPYLHTEMTGKAVLVINKGRSFFNEKSN